MKIRYFHETDTLYIEFRAAAVSETRDLDENTASSRSICVADLSGIDYQQVAA